MDTSESAHLWILADSTTQRQDPTQRRCPVATLLLPVPAPSACSDQLQQVVRDMERLYVDASRCLSLSGRALAGAVVPKGPEPSLVQVVEAMQDTW